MSITFGGSTINRPGSYSQVDTSSMVVKSLGSLRVLAVVGAPGTGGSVSEAQNDALYFNSPVDALAAVGTGATYDVMAAAWQHGADLIAWAPVIGTGSGGVVQDSDWDTALGLLEKEFVDGIIPVSTNGAIQAKVDTHCTTMSNVSNRKERRAFYGHAAGLDVSAVSALTSTLNGERALLASPAVYVTDSSGNKVLKDSTLLAAAYAGIWAQQEPQVPITYKYVKFAGLEKIYKGTEIDALLQAHVAVTEYIRGKGFRIVKGITTSSSTDLTKQELSVSTLKDAMSRNIREYFEDKYVGQAGVAGIETTIYNDLVSMLEGFKKLGWISDYVKGSVQVTKNGTSFSLDWEGKPTLPINNFLITSHFTL
jgi:hypothetical protein